MRLTSFFVCYTFLDGTTAELSCSLVQDIADSQKGVALVNVFVDEPYNRTGFTLAAYETSAVCLDSLLRATGHELRKP